MRIVYLHQYFNSRSMSGGTRSFEMARRLVSSGHDVHIVTTFRQQTKLKGWFQTEEAGIYVHWYPIAYSNHMNYFKRIAAFIKFAFVAAQKATSLKVDLIFATSTPLTIGLPAVYAARKCRVPMVFEVRDLWPDVPIAIGALKNQTLVYIARKLEKFVYRNSARVIALSPGIREGVAKSGYPEDFIKVVPNGCDFDLFEVSLEIGKSFRNKYAWLKNRPLVLYSGTLGKINGVDYLVRLAAQVKSLDSEIRFLVVGEGREESHVRELAEKLEVLDNNFFMLPALPKEDMASIYSAATIVTSLFVDLKAMEVNSANKFFDALAAGRPIAINYGGWQAELLKDAGAGLLLDWQNLDASARYLTSKLRDKRWLEAAGNAARDLGRSRFCRNTLYGLFEQQLNNAFAERRL